MDAESTQQFAMPPELQQRPPRQVRRRAGSSGCGIVMGRLFILPFMLVGLFLLLVMVPASFAAVYFGEVRDGRLVKTWTTKSSKGSISYHMKYDYDVGGVEHTSDKTISKKEYDKLSGWGDPQWSGPLKVHTKNILGHFFAEVVLPDEATWEPVFYWLIFALFWNGLVFIFVYLLWIWPWQQKRLYRFGTPVPGRIYGKHTTRGKTTTYYLDYEFVQPPFGLRKKHQSVPLSRYGLAHETEMVTVMCYPGKKWPTAIYEYGDFECF